MMARYGNPGLVGIAKHGAWPYSSQIGKLQGVLEVFLGRSDDLCCTLVWAALLCWILEGGMLQTNFLFV